MKNKKIFRIAAMLLAVSVLVLCGCSGSNNAGSSTQKADYKIAKGETCALTTSLKGDVQWHSPLEDYAIVDRHGNVTALKDRGTVTIIASVNGQIDPIVVELCSETEFGPVHLESTDQKLTIGAWNGSYHDFDDFRLDMMAQAGITLLVGVEERWMSLYTMDEMLSLAQEYGVSVITNLRDWDGESIPDYVNNSGLMGFLMYDEPCATEFEKLAELKKKFDAVMPEDTLFYVNLFPEGCAYEDLFGDPYNPLKVDYEANYSNLFMDTVVADMMSVDAYPLQEGGYIRQSYVHCLEVVAQKAKSEGVPFWYTLCTSGHSTTDGRYGTPTEEELRWQMCMGLTYGAEYLLHYVLASHETDDYECMLEYGTWEPTPLYDDVCKVDAEFLSWQDIYMSYDWVGTARIDVGQKNPLLRQMEYSLPLEKAGLLTDVKADGDLLVGVFEANGGYGYMITNTGDTSECDLWLRLNHTTADVQATLQLADGSYQCAAVIENGQISYVPVNTDNTVDITVDAYNGVFVIPVMN